MQYRVIVNLILKKGVDNVSIPHSIREKSLNEAGILLAKQRKYEESAKAFAKANNLQGLLELGDWLMAQGQVQHAARYYKYSRNKEKMEACALICADQGFSEAAKELFIASGNKAMLSFLEENYTQ